MGLFGTMKSNAKRMLSGAWGRAILLLLLMLLPVMLINLLEAGVRSVSNVSSFVDYAGTAGNALDDTANLSIISSLITAMMTIFLFILVTPMKQGMARWYYRRTDGGNDGVFELFHYFETARDYFRSLAISFSVGVRRLLWSMLFSLPLVGLITVGFLLEDKMPERVAMIGSLLLFFWVILAAIIVELIATRYFLAPYLLAADPTLTARQAIKQSVKLTRGQRGSLFLFHLSFLLWFIPLVLVLLLMLPALFEGPLAIYAAQGGMLFLLVVQMGLLIYVQPYLSAACAVYARYLLQSGEGDGSMTREYTAQKLEIDGDTASVPENPTRETPLQPAPQPENDADAGAADVENP